MSPTTNPMSNRFQTVTAIAVLVLLPVVCARAQRSSFVTTLGNDTLSFEQFDRTPSSIVGDWVTTYGGIVYHHYVIDLRPDHTVSRYRLSLHRANGQDEGSVELRFEGDTVTIPSSSDPGTNQRVVAPAAFPLFANTVATLDLIVSRAHDLHRDSSVTSIVPAFGPYRRGGMPVVFFGGDSAWLGNPRAPLYASVDAAGHIAGLSGRATTTRTLTRRVTPYDLAAVIAHFPDVSADTPIRGVYAISPRDTVRAQIGSATITIDYGRPASRGRDVFAHGVLGDTLWRTGANAATQFTTTEELLLGKDTLRAGTYSLWTRVSPDNQRYALVFNSQTGQWGTEHHAERDVLSVPLRRVDLAKPVERFTIALSSGAKRGELRLEWSARSLVLPVVAR